MDHDGAVLLRYPLRGRCRVENSPADRVPSHGTRRMGTAYAIDFVPVDARGRSARMSWRALLATERPEAFVGFGAAVVAPRGGTIVVAHDGEPDHEARRSQPALLAYALGQPGRLRLGAAAIAGNHVVIALDALGPFVLVAHLQRGSVRATAGDRVRAGDVVGACGNSGNSTQPHVHVQVTDSLGWATARGLPVAFEGWTGPELPSRSDLIEPRP